MSGGGVRAGDGHGQIAGQAGQGEADDQHRQAHQKGEYRPAHEETQHGGNVLVRTERPQVVLRGKSVVARFGAGRQCPPDPQRNDVRRGRPARMPADPFNSVLCQKWVVTLGTPRAA